MKYAKSAGRTRVNHPDLLALVNDEVRARVATGELEVVTGKLAEKPVVRDAISKQVVPGVGSGQYPGASNLGLVSKQTGFKRSRPYREALEALAPYDGDESTAGSLAWWYAKARWAAAGSPQKADCHHEGCGEKHSVVMKPDGNIIFKFIEMLVGKAPATMDLTVDATLETLHTALQQRETTIRVVSADSDESVRRVEAVAARFRGEGDSIEAEFVSDATAGDPATEPEGEEE